MMEIIIHTQRITYFLTLQGSDLNNGGYKLEPNTTYTLSVYARKNGTITFEDSNFNLFAYDGLAGLQHNQTNLIIENSFKSEDFLASSEWKRYSFTFTTGEVSYPNHNNDLNGTNNNSQIAHPRFGVTLPKGVDTPQYGTISIWGLQLEKSYKPTMYVLNDGTDKYDDPKEEVKISDNPNMYFVWYDGNTNYESPQSYPNVSIGLTSARSSGSFREKYLPRQATDKSPAIIEYPGIINSLDGGPSKESLSAQDWVYNKLYDTDFTTNYNYYQLSMDYDQLIANSSSENRHMGIEVESSYWTNSNNNYFYYYNCCSYNEYYFGEYNNGLRTSKYWTTHHVNNDFEYHYNKILNHYDESSNKTKNPHAFFIQFESDGYGDGLDEFNWYVNNHTNHYYQWIGLVKERDFLTNDLIDLRWLGPHDKPILLGHHNGHSYFFIRHLKTADEHTTYANGLGAYLFNPDSIEEYKFIKSNLLSKHWAVPYDIDDNNTISSRYMDQVFTGIQYNTDGYSGYKLSEIDQTSEEAELKNDFNFNSLLPGQTITLVFSKTIQDSEMDLGGYSNSLTVTANNGVSQVSDDPNTTEDDDPTVVNFDIVKELEVIKTAVVIDNDF